MMCTQAMAFAQRLHTGFAGAVCGRGASKRGLYSILHRGAHNFLYKIYIYYILYIRDRNPQGLWHRSEISLKQFSERFFSNLCVATPKNPQKHWLFCPHRGSHRSRTDPKGCVSLVPLTAVNRFLKQCFGISRDS